MYINEIKETFLDYPDDSSLAVIVFFEGCFWNCKDCQNKTLQKQNPEHKYHVIDAATIILDSLKRSKTNKLVLSGGDPFYNSNCAIRLIDYLSSRGIDICVYTGYSIDQILSLYEKYEIANQVGMHKPLWIKCGVFREDLKDPNMGKFADKFVLASTNQAFFKLNEKGEYVQMSNKNVLNYE